MSSTLYLAWRYLAYHRFKTSILVASITLIVYLPVGLRVLVGQSGDQLTSRAASTPLLVGARGSPLVEVAAGESAEFAFRTLRPGTYFINVEASAPSNELAKDSGYVLQVKKVEPFEPDYGPFPDEDPHKDHDHDK